MSSRAPSFNSLRLSQADYDRHASRSKSSKDVLNFNKNSLKLEVIGENEEIKKVLRKSSGAAGQDWTQGVEKMIRIPMKHWVLAGDSMVFPHKNITSLEHFKQPQTPPFEVILLPASDEGKWIVANRKLGRWKRFPHKPPPASQLPANPRARAQALFPLLDTTESPPWAECIVHRQAAEVLVDEVSQALDNLEDAAYWKMIRDASLESLYGEDDLTEEECKKIADALTNVDLDVMGDGDEENVSTRIHSLVAPKSVDMHLSFHRRARMYSVEASYSFGFRINKVPVPPLEDSPDDDRKVNRMHTGNGWKTFDWFYLDKGRSEHSACPASARDLKQVHDALFGPAKKGGLGERISLCGTVKLMLASVGIAFEVALDEEGENENGDGHKCSDDARLELAAQKPGISAAHLRKICGIPPLDDDDMADLSKEQVTAPMDPSEDEYGSDDDG